MHGVRSNLGRVGAMLKNKLPICTYPFGDFMRMSPHFCECKHDQKHWGSVQQTAPVAPRAALRCAVHPE